MLILPTIHRHGQSVICMPYLFSSSYIDGITLWKVGTQINQFDT